MKKIREYILKGKEISIGLEDSKKTWKLTARSGRTIVNETSMPAEYENLHRYLANKYPCKPSRLSRLSECLCGFLNKKMARYCQGFRVIAT